MSGAECVLAGDLAISAARREVIRQGRPISLTSLEFDLLVYLVQQRDQVASYDELLDQVWGYSAETGDPAQVRNAVRRLRKKLGDHATQPRYIANVRGVGYRWVTPVSPSQEQESRGTDTKRIPF